MAKIKRFKVLKMASFIALYSAFAGLIIGIFLAIISLFIPSQYSALFGLLGLGGLLSIFIYPIIYGILGFISGLIFTPIMNLSLKIIKGLDLDLEMTDSGTNHIQQPMHPPKPTQQIPQLPTQSQHQSEY